MKINQFQTILRGQTVFDGEPETFEEAVVGFQSSGSSRREALLQAARQFPAQHLIWKVRQARTPDTDQPGRGRPQHPATPAEQAALLEFEMTQNRRGLSEDQRRRINDEIDRLMKRATIAKRRDPDERPYTISGLIGILENELGLKGAEKHRRTLQRVFAGLPRNFRESDLLARLSETLDNGRGRAWHARQLRDHIQQRRAARAVSGRG